MTMRKYCLLVLLPLIAATLIGCSPPPTTPQGPNATLLTEYGSGSGGFGMNLRDPGVNLVLDPAPSCAIANINVQSDTSGAAQITLACLPEPLLSEARYPSANCQSTNGSDASGRSLWVYTGITLNANSSPYNLPCGSITPAAIISPASMLLTNPPDVLTMSSPAGSFNTNYGSPVAYFYDDYGNFLGQSTAQTVASDGSSITFAPDPLVSNGAVGTFGVAVYNANGDGTLEPNQAASIVVRAIVPPGPPKTCQRCAPVLED